MKYIILNPKAGRGYSASIRPQICDYFKKQNIKHVIVDTAYPGHAAELARQGVEMGATEIISVGGDGTLFETIQYVYDQDVTFSMIPAGTGNDFCRSLGFSLDLDECLKQLETAKTAQVDLCQGTDHVFLSVSGIGFVSDVLHYVNTHNNSILKGQLAFINGVIQTLRRLKANTIDINIDGKIFQRDIVLAAIVNSEFVGGGMKFIPQSRMDDGKIYLMIVKDIKKLEFLRVFPKVYKGTHIGHPAIEIFEGQHIVLKSGQALPDPMIKSFDGNLNGKLPMDVQVLQSKLRVKVPRDYQPNRK